VAWPSKLANWQTGLPLFGIFVACGKFVYHYRNYLLRRGREAAAIVSSLPLTLTLWHNLADGSLLCRPTKNEKENRKKKEQQQQCYTTVMWQVSIKLPLTKNKKNE